VKEEHRDVGDRVAVGALQTDSKEKGQTGHLSHVGEKQHKNKRFNKPGRRPSPRQGIGPWGTKTSPIPKGGGKELETAPQKPLGSAFLGKKGRAGSKKHSPSLCKKGCAPSMKSKIRQGTKISRKKSRGRESHSCLGGEDV